MGNTLSGLIATSFPLQVAQSYLELCFPYASILQDTTLLDGSLCIFGNKYILYMVQGLPDISNKIVVLLNKLAVSRKQNRLFLVLT